MGVDETLRDAVDRRRESSLVGKMLGAYRIDRLLGEGAMGEVFAATHIALARPVAIKTLKPAADADRELTQRFFNEARAVNVIRHENIVECTDLVNDPDGRSYIVMELLEGRTLREAIHEAGRLPVDRTLRIADQIAGAIAAAHAKGIIHRDLKPDNIFLIARAGTTDYVKVLDFGIARLLDGSPARDGHAGSVVRTGSGVMMGAPAYMSPEQVRGDAEVGPGSDIYALGAILFQMLTGRLPFEVTLPMMLVAQLHETPPRADAIVPEVPRRLADLIERMLAKDAADRPADMAAFRRELARVTEPDTVEPPDPQPDPEPPPRRRWIHGAIVGAAAIAIVAIAWRLASSSGDAGPVVEPELDGDGSHKLSNPFAHADVPSNTGHSAQAGPTAPAPTPAQTPAVDAAVDAPVRIAVDAAPPAPPRPRRIQLPVPTTGPLPGDLPGGFACAPGRMFRERDADEALAEIERANRLTHAELDDELRARGTNREDYRQRIARHLLAIGCRCPGGYVARRDDQAFVTCRLDVPDTGIAPAPGKTRAMCAPMGKPNAAGSCDCADGWISRREGDTYGCVKP